LNDKLFTINDVKKMEITTETDLLNALSKCPDEIISIDIHIQSRQPPIFDLSNCINLITITLFCNRHNEMDINLSNCNKLINLKLIDYNTELNLKKCINLTTIYITRFNIPLDLSNCTNLISINLPQYDYTINLTEFKNLNNIILSPINNSFNMIYFKKINKLEDTISELIEKIEKMSQNKSYFT
jgi:hypothetical protein